MHLRLLTLAIVLSLTAPGLVAPAHAAESLAAERVAGADRFATAAALAQRAAGRSAPRVWIATGSDFPDALAAGATGEPVLLVTGRTVPAPTASALRAIDPDEVVAVGGTGVIADTVLQEAAQHGRARSARVSGAHRYATSVAVSLRTHPDGASVVWMATGLGFADALAAGPVAAAEGAPLLLVAGDRLTDSVRSELARLDPDRLVAVGGRGVLSDEVLAEAAAAAGQAAVHRLAGPDRFSTAAAVADHARTGLGFGEHAYLATGQSFPDALAAGPAAARVKAPLLLATRTRLPEATRQTLLWPEVTRLTVVGGVGALSLTVFHRAARPAAAGACDAYDATDPTPIEGHPEGLRPNLDAWAGPWVIDTYRGTWGISVPYRWRVDKQETFESRGALFYVDTENGYDHWLSVTVFCGNPFLVGPDRSLPPDDPAQIASAGPHTVHGNPDFERTGGPTLYTAAWYGETEAQRYDYVAVGDDVILIHYAATNRFARRMADEIARLADAVAASAAPADQVRCPAHAPQCHRR